MNLMVYEKKLWESGIEYIACCDEVGRGCLFGSVVAAAVVLKPFDHIAGVVDSKKLSAKKRELLFDEIVKKSVAVGIGEVSVPDIEAINIKQASRKAMKIAIENLKTAAGMILKPEYLLIDAETIDLPYAQQSVIRGEDHVHGIAAASIIAKVTRDRMCLAWHRLYPQYGLDSNKGYSTKVHQEALTRYGATPLHRKSFIKKYLLQTGV
jgi:ribonuclease HII